MRKQRIRKIHRASEKHETTTISKIYIKLWFLEQGALEKNMTTHSSTLAWKIPWTEERGGLQSMGSLTVGHD